MASEKDLLDKADALLRRHALGTGAETGTYPVLTDLVMPPDAKADAEEAPGHAPEEAPGHASAEAPAAPQEPEPGLHEEIVARVLAELRTRLGVDLERQVAETLAPQLRTAVKEAMAGLEDRLATIVAEAVSRALEDRPVK